jgi:hypothetical protein
MPKNIYSNPRLVLQRLQNQPYAFRYIHNVLKNDRHFILKALRVNESTFSYLSDDLKNNRGFVLEAVIRNGHVLQYIDNRLKYDKDIVLAAVRENGMVLLHVADCFKHDKDVVTAAIRHICCAAEFMDEKLRNDKGFIDQILADNLFVYKYLGYDDTLTGKQFNQLFPDAKLRKKIKDDMVMKGFKYQIGLNKDIFPFNTKVRGQAGGLHCTTEQYIDYFPDDVYGSSVYEVKIPDDAQVCIEGPYSLKADMLEIVRKID